MVVEKRTGLMETDHQKQFSENNGKTRTNYEKAENVHYFPYVLKIYNFHTEHQLLENY